MIITVTLNAVVDKTYTVENYTLDRVHRPSGEKRTAGGKGINVARVLRTLGRDVVATGFVGGHNGELIISDLDREGITHEFVQTRVESRFCIAVVDPVNHTQTEVNESGPTVGPDEIEALRAKIESLLPSASHIVLSGSAPPGVPNGFYAWAIEAAKAAGVQSILDASGEPLRLGVTALPYMVKPNVVELSAYVERELYTVEDILEAANGLARSGIKFVVVSMGKSGAIVTDGSEAWHATPPEIDFVSAVGSGDSFVAAFVDALVSGNDMQDALVAGTAAGASDAMIAGSGFCTVQSIESLKPGVQIVRLA